MLRSLADHIRTVLGIEDVNQIEEDVRAYAELINSNKYGDSNSNTDALEKLVKSMNLGPADYQEELKQDEVALQPSLDETNQKVKWKYLFKEQQELLNTLNEKNFLPAQPVFQPPKFGIEEGVDFKLGVFKIPWFIYQSLETKNINSLDIKSPLTPDNYVERFQRLLWYEEAYQEAEMRRYDLHNVMLAKYEGDFFMLEVPGLAEGRPSLMRGDRLLLISHKRSSYYEGYTYAVREHDILFKMNERLHSTAMDGLSFDVSFMSSRTPFRRCHQAICQFETNPSIKIAAFPQMPTRDRAHEAGSGLDILEQDYRELRIFNSALNEHQRRAVFNVIKGSCRPSPYIVFGPPGTGKTVTLVEAILQIYTRENHFKILVCGNSNASADILAERLFNSNVVAPEHMVRISAFYRMENLVPTNLKDLTKCMDEITPTDYSRYRIVVTTCCQASALNGFRQRFDYVLIDEAGHASEPEAMICIGLLKRGGTCALAGDPHQLGPFCVSHEAFESGLGISMLERLTRRAAYQRRCQDSKMTYDERYLTKLILSYRCDPRVLVVNNELFYHNELKFSVNTPKRWLNLLGVSSPLVFHPVKGKDRREYTNPSWFNANEALTCLMYVHKLYKAGLLTSQLGIITPYRRQIDKIKLLFDEMNIPRCKIATMEEFQGDEREIIIISTVRAQEKNVKYDKKFLLGFLFNPKRFNVAISRAKWMVITVGDPSILALDDCWARYMENAHQVKET